MEMTQDDKFIIAHYQQELANRDMALALEKSKTMQLEAFIRDNIPANLLNPVPTESVIPTDAE